MKSLKRISVIWLMFFVASAISNWGGGGISKNPVFVFVGIVVTALAYGLFDEFDR